MKSRIAIFSGYGTPFRGASSSSLGRRGYYVPPRDTEKPYRRGYVVKAMRDTPAMKRAQKRFKTCARKCAKQRGARSKFPSCMRRCAKKKSKR